MAGRRGGVMGAAYFRVYYPGTDPRPSFNDAVSSAAYEYGHGGYTGTIAEKDSYVMRNGGKPVPKKEAKEFAYRDGEENDKWGPAYCIAVSDDADPSKIVGHLFYGYASE
jgi:hypothetical protein